MADCSQRYVLFIGAGVSKDAGIPSGWDILIDTLKKIRKQEEPTQDYSNEAMEKYYKEKYEEKYSYSEIISSLFPSTEEQREYLKDRFKGISYGEAHEIIAEMVKKGLIKYIITTNFDSLLEAALDSKGIKGQYSVISSEEDVKTSKPWNKETVCRIYKIHGTLEQGLIRNTKKDLQSLPEDLTKDFHDVIERNGIVVLGYGAHEDEKAIFDIFNSRRFKGYTLYWADYNKQISQNAKKIITKQDGITIPITGAASFLRELLNRIEIAQRGVEQTSEAVAEVRYESVMRNPEVDVEMLQIIEREKINLIKYINDSISQMKTVSVASFWEATENILKNSYNYLLLMEKIAKYRKEYWKNVVPIFEKVSSLNKTRDRAGSKGLINYVFYCLLELCGAILVENEKFDLLQQLLEVKRLNFNKNGVESILNWPIYSNFILAKNEQEALAGNPKYLFPQFHYLLGFIEIKRPPFEFDMRERIIEADLLYFVYSIKYPMDGYSYSWFPSSPVYCKYDIPELLKKVKFDASFGDKLAKELFNCSYDQLLTILAKAKELMHSELKSAYFHSHGAEEVFDDF